MKLSGLYILLGLSVLLAPVFIYLLWGWIVPDVFAGMVKEGLLPSNLEFWQVMKIWVGLIAYRLFIGSGKTSSK